MSLQWVTVQFSSCSHVGAPRVGGLLVELVGTPFKHTMTDSYNLVWEKVLELCCTNFMTTQR